MKLSKRDAEYLFAQIQEACKPRKVGDKVKTWNIVDARHAERGTTTITKIEGDIVTCANGESMHISKVRSAE